MPVLADLLSWLDNKRRVVGRNMSDLATDPSGYLSMTAANIPQTIAEQGAGMAPMGLSMRGVVGPQHEALRLAQERAALPVERYGLGLSPDNTPQMRAAAMEFVNPVYRGEKGNVTVLIPKRSPRNEQMNLSSIHVAESPDYANRYATGNGELVLPLVMRNGDTVDASSLVNVPSPEFEYLKALLPRGQKPYVSRGGAGGPEDPMFAPPLQNAIDAAGPQKAEKVFTGKDSLKYNAKYGTISNDGRGMYVNQVSPAYAILNPDNIRSRFAAFDPWRRNTAIAAALGVAAPDLLAAQRRPMSDLMDPRTD